MQRSSTLATLHENTEGTCFNYYYYCYSDKGRRTGRNTLSRPVESSFVKWEKPSSPCKTYTYVCARVRVHTRIETLTDLIYSLYAHLQYTHFQGRYPLPAATIFILFNLLSFFHFILRF